MNKKEKKSHKQKREEKKNAKRLRREAKIHEKSLKRQVRSQKRNEIKNRLEVTIYSIRRTLKTHLWLQLLTMVLLTMLLYLIVFISVSKISYKAHIGETRIERYDIARRDVENQILDSIRYITETSNYYSNEASGEEHYYGSNASREAEYSSSEENTSNTDSAENVDNAVNIGSTQDVATTYEVSGNDSLKKSDTDNATTNENDKITPEETPDIETDTTPDTTEVDDSYEEKVISGEWSGLAELDIEQKSSIKNQIDLLNDASYFNQFLEGSVVSTKTYFLDSTGLVLCNDEPIKAIDLVKIIKQINNNRDQQDNVHESIYPMSIGENVYYLYNESTLLPTVEYEYSELGNVLGVITATGLIIVLIFYLTSNKISYIEYINKCVREISKGNLDYDIDIVGEDELSQVAESIMYMEHELKMQIEDKINVEKSKNDLVTNVAHDLRTPLTSIIGYLGLLKNKAYKDDEELNKYVDIAFNKSEKLKVLIEDLFELTKLYQGGIKLNLAPVSIGNILNQLIGESMPLAQDKNIEIESYVDSSNMSINVDPAKITRVFDNLIGNAIKYSEPNETIYVELRNLNDYVLLAVSNPNHGIEEEELDKFFEKFYRADKSRNSSVSGSGLGLAIAKSIVELHGGIIKAELIEDLITFKVILKRK